MTFAADPLCATIDTSAQVDGNRVFRFVDDTWARGWWIDKPTLPQDWAVTRYDGTLREIADWWSLSDPRQNYEMTPDGEFRFKPSPGTKPALDEWALRAGLRPVIVLANNTMPAPLIEGGYLEGQYGYNIRQPIDYAKWQRYVESALQWLVAQYGRPQVKTWTFMFGIESDWQAKAVVPGTQTEMSPADNRREYMKLVDHFQAACEKVLGPTVYVGIYFAFETQADDYLEHWARGTNFATGRTGTRIGYCGFSDWTHVGTDDKNPFSLSGLKRRQAHGNAETVDAWAGGLVWKYDHIARRMDAEGLPRAMEIGLPEAGYFDDRGGLNSAGADVPCDVLYADHRGAALRTMRTAAYAACPRLRWAWNRYALGTGDLAHVYADEAKPPVFHAIRLEKKLEGERMLPVDRTGAPQDPSNDVRVIASATDAPGVAYRLVAVSFNENFAAATPEPLRLRLSGLGPATSIRVTEYRIDADHNNWWPEWKNWREANGLPYVAGANSGQFGSGILYKPQYAPWQADVIGTLRPEDVPKWMAKSAEYHARDGLAPTATRTIAVANGVAIFDTTLQANSVLYLEVSGAPQHLVPIDTPPVRLSPFQKDARITRTLTGLKPGAAYTVLCTAQASGRMMDYRLTAGPPLGPGRIEALGDWSARPNRLVVTARSDAAGALAISLSAPKQPCDADDVVEFRDLRVIAH
jgi:hypothetical protein